MEQTVIREPQLPYLLELLTELGDAANDFILAGAQAMRLAIGETRDTRDFDFVLDVVSLREATQSIGDTLTKLGYEVDPKAMRLQFTKDIPNSRETMRIEFLAPEREKRQNPKEIRVDVQPGLHARACKGQKSC
ncbi:MAG: hypothetical protein QME66_04525 [Candidatus Eisenbacteria bacterium]|nr:hypothetical protein [Candidatus Eisenbacteria bacterium]